MDKILIPVDGSEISLRAVQFVIGQFKKGRSLTIHVLNVQPPFMGDVQLFVHKQAIEQYHREEGKKALADALTLLDASGIPYDATMRVGHIADTIARYAKDQGCDEIVMGTHGWGAATGLLMGSIATRVLHKATLPVTFVK